MFLIQLLQFTWPQLPLFFLLPLTCMQTEPFPPSTLRMQLISDSPTLWQLFQLPLMPLTQTESFPPSPRCWQLAEVLAAVSATSTLATSTLDTPVAQDTSSPDY